MNWKTLQVWDTMIIESALKKFYGSDLSSMIQAIITKYLVRLLLRSSALGLLVIGAILFAELSWKSAISAAALR